MFLSLLKDQALLAAEAFDFGPKALNFARILKRIQFIPNDFGTTSL